MIIKGHLKKDYYDHVAHIYGGGDPKIVYMRKRLTPLETDKFMSSAIAYPLNLKFQIKRDLRVIDTPTYNSDKFKYLCVAGKYYLLVCPKGQTKFELLNQDKHPEIVADLVRPRLFGESKPFAYFSGYACDNLTELSKLVKAPVFIIHGYTWDWKDKETYLSIESEIPNLGDLGLASIYPAEQLYQDLAYFIGNKMQDSPDLAPPVEIADKDRIVQHGFDIKKSFRHRV